MAEWVLVMVLQYGPSGTAASISFIGVDACQRAGQEIAREWHYMRPRWMCIRKGMASQ